MGNAKIWWWPTGAATVEEVDFGATWTDMRIAPRRSGSDAVAGWGRATRYDAGGWRDVTITKERIANNAALIRDLRSLIQHLQAGGVCAASLDADKAWGTWAPGFVLAGGTTFNVAPAGNAFASLNASAALASGDEILIESPNPEYLADVNTYSSLTGSTFQTGEAIRTGFKLAPAFVRYRWFFPVLRLPASRMSGDELLTHDRLMNWTCVLPLEERPGDILALQTEAAALMGSASGGTRLDELLRRDSRTRRSSVREKRGR